MARNETTDCFSVIFDKWSSNTTICPFLARSPVSCWQSLKAYILRLHVMLVVAHLRGGNRNLFFTADGSVGGGANFTIDCLHRALLALAEGGALKPIGYFQADSASDNKCHSMLYFLGYLVQHDMLRHAYLSMLVVHHTHEDVDQVFSVGSRYLYKGIQCILSPTEWANALRVAYCALNATYTTVRSINDWSSFFGLTKTATSTRVGDVYHHLV